MINTVICDDCFNVLKDMEDCSVDLICIDPPYGINYAKFTWDIKTSDLIYPTLKGEFYRLLKSTGNLIMFQGWSNVHETIIMFKRSGLSLRNWIIYDRIKGRGAKRNLMSTREDILWFTKSDNYTYNKIYSNIPKKTKGMGCKNGQPNRALSNVWSDISPIVPWSKERLNHPTQKPLQLMERIITIFSNEKDTVLDCFAGSGSTLVAAKNLNRKYIGIEKEKEYYDIASGRLV